MLAAISRVLIILAACGVGAVAHVSIRGLSWTPDMKKVQQRDERKQSVDKEHEKFRATMGVSLEEFQTLISQGAVVIDARPQTEFEKEHLRTESMPPVLNVEPQNVVPNLERLNQLLGMQFVFYCTSETCELAEELFVELRPYGFTDVKIFFPGWEGIKKSSLPTMSGPDTWTGFDAPPAEPGGADGVTEDKPEEE